MWRRIVSSGVGALALAVGFVVSTLAPAATAGVYTNPGTITIPGIGAGTPFPSAVSVPAGGVVADVNVTLTDITHTWPHKIWVLLQGPSGQHVVLMSGTGDDTDISGVDLTIDDQAGASLPLTGVLTSGTYKPTDGYPGFTPGPPSPNPPHASSLSIFDGTSAGGTWSLFVADYATGDSGSIGGWSLDLTLATVAPAPAAGKAGDQIVLTGSGFTGATAVRFGSTLAATYSVDSGTQITTVVPTGAGTGPIEVVVPSGTIASSIDFVVRHVRSTSLDLSGTKGSGTVEVADGFSSCAAKVPVKVQLRNGQRWVTLAAVLTKPNGSFRAIRLTDHGKYRAITKKTTLPTGDVCLKDISPVVKK